MNKPEAKDSDRRENERHPFHSTAQLLLTGGDPLNVRTKDISLGGVAIVSARNLPSAATGMIKLNFSAPPRGTVTYVAQVKVRHSVFSSQEDGFKVGLTFTTLQATLASAIQGLVKR